MIREFIIQVIKVKKKTYKEQHDLELQKLAIDEEFPSLPKVGVQHGTLFKCLTSKRQIQQLNNVPLPKC